MKKIIIYSLIFINFLIFCIFFWLYVSPTSNDVKIILLNLRIMRKRGLNMVRDYFNPPYRLGDMIRGNWYNLPGGPKAHLKKYPNSIVAEYLKSTNKHNNWKILFKILKKKKISIKPKKTDLIVHLRLGDVIEYDNSTVKQILKNGNPYIKPYSYYEDIIKKIQKYDIKNVYLTTGFHIVPSSGLTKSMKYINNIEKLFKKHRYTVIKRINNKPDEDFIFMSNAHYICLSKGSFSYIIKHMVEMNKKTIIE